MKIIKIALGLIVAAFLLVLAAGIYKFNFTNDDIYVENENGEFVQIDILEEDGHSNEEDGEDQHKEDVLEETEDKKTDNDEVAETGVVYQSKYLEDYSIKDTTFGTEVTVTVSGSVRAMVSNALPNHQTGDFPNSGNPNSISAQNSSYTFPINPEWTGSAVWAREPGVAINGVKFEPETAERVNCSTGEQYKVEAVQNLVDLGLDFNNAHVQPTGAYHYHGVSQNLANAFDMGEDLVHVGFAADGYLIYYSQSGKYSPSYRTSDEKREGSSCSYTGGGPNGGIDNVPIAGTTPDGTYVSDWEYVAGFGDLDQCNGVVIDGTYTYLITNEYPYIGRCLNGSFTENHLSGGGSSQAGLSGPDGQGQFPPQGPPPRR